MRLTIDLPKEDILTLVFKAKVLGISAEQCARQIIQSHLSPEWLQKSWSTAEQTGSANLSMDEIEAEIAAARRVRRIDLV